MHFAAQKDYDFKILKAVETVNNAQKTRLVAKMGADCLAILTEWSEFRRPDFARMQKLMRSPVIFDGRNLFTPEQMKQYGFTYYSIGRH